MTQKSGFDAMAEHYDEDFVHSAIGLLQRRLVHLHLEPIISENAVKRVLDMGSGTGEDLLFFGDHGLNGIGIDSSQVMITKATEKLTTAQYQMKFQLHKIDVIDYLSSTEEVNFDMVFSNFGALNCIQPSDLKEVVQALHARIHRGGYVVLVVMTSFCLWESIYFLWKGKRDKASRRWRRDSTIFETQECEDLNIWYYSPRKLYTLFKDYFTLHSIRPVGCFIPPSYMEPALKRKPLLLKGLFKMDRLTATLSPLAYLSDHFLIVMQKKENG